MITALVISGGLLAECMFGKTLHGYLERRALNKMLKRW
jgi:hypothetical protein